jgi:hypothetical protein
MREAVTLYFLYFMVRRNAFRRLSPHNNRLQRTVRCAARR